MNDASDNYHLSIEHASEQTGWGGRRPGAGRKPNPNTALRRLHRRQLAAARGLEDYAILLADLGAEPREAVEAARRAARRLVARCRQYDLPLLLQDRTTDDASPER